MPKIKFTQALRFWVRLGFINFGGPAGQIALMHKELVERRRWISEEQFLRALNFCMLLPGPEAQQLACYIGWRLHGILGGLVAGSFFVIPSIFVLLSLSWLAVTHAHLPAVAGFFYGIQPAVIAIVVDAMLRIGKKTLRHPTLVCFAAAAFVLMYFFSVPFPMVIAIAALCGIALRHYWPHLVPAQQTQASGSVGYPAFSRAIKLGAIFFLLWAVPVGALWLWRGSGDVLIQEALFFTKAAFITFGGAYAVLSYMADAAVNHYGWLDARQMIQGLGLAESTPGPLIMVTQYVGFLGAWKFHGEFAPLLYGTLGAFITTYVTFLPSCFFIFIGAPYIEVLARYRRVQAAMVGVTSAVVGVILNLAVFFSSRALFQNGGGTLDYFALVTAVLWFLLLRWGRMQVYVLVPLSAVIGMAWNFLIK